MREQHAVVLAEECAGFDTLLGCLPRRVKVYARETGAMPLHSGAAASEAMPGDQSLVKHARLPWAAGVATIDQANPRRPGSEASAGWRCGCGC
jgi:hypothetical protein